MSSNEIKPTIKVIQEHSDLWLLLGPSSTLPNRATFYQHWLDVNQPKQWEFVQPLKDAIEELVLEGRLANIISNR